MTATSVNSLTFESGGGLTIADYRTLTNASGGILAKTSATIATTGSGIGKGALFGNSNTEAVIFVFGAANTLTIEAPVGGALAPSTGGLTLSGNGKLVLASTTGNNYGGTTTVQLGTFQLGASAPDNALSFKFATSSGIGGSTSAISLNALVSNGGIFDLNGHSQSTLLLSRGTLPGSGGVITNTATGSAVNLTHVQDGNNRDFAGQLNGNLNLRATGLGTTTLRDNNQFTGNATIMGAPVVLADQGRFSGMGSGDTISIRNSILRWDDTGLQSLSNRISTAVTIELDGGTFEFLSRGAAASTISLGNLSLVGGTSTLRGTGGSAGFGNGTLALTGTFTRSVGATLNITSGAGVVGASPYFTATATALGTNTNGILGGWATVYTANGTTVTSDVEFATYDPIVGIRPLNGVEQTASFAASGATSNLRFTGTQTVPSAGATVNSVTMNSATAATLAFAVGSDTLTVTSGGILGGAGDVARSIGSATSRGKITSGGSELFIHNAKNTLTIYSELTGTLSPVFTSAGQTGGSVIALANANTYVGTAYVNGVVLNLGVLGATSTTDAITGDIVVTGGTTNGTASGAVANSSIALQASNQLADAANLTVRGGARFIGGGFSDTIASLVMQSHGGFADGGPLVWTGSGRLTLTGGITVNKLEDLRSIPLIQGNLGLPATATISVEKFIGSTVLGTLGHANEQVGLTINSHVSGGASLTKTGNGALQLGGTSTSVSEIAINAGALVLSTANYPSAKVTLAANTVLDMRGQTNGQIGSVVSASSSAAIKNFSLDTAGKLVTGADGTSGTFAGLIGSDYTSGKLSLTKIGSGAWTLTADNAGSILDTLQVNGGSIVLAGASARTGFVTTILAEGGSLVLDNSTNVLANRLGGTTSIMTTTADRTLSMRGGQLTFIGGSAAVTEAFNIVTNLEGMSAFSLTAGTAATTLNIATLSTSSGTNRGGLYLDAGSGLLGGAAAGSGRVNVIAATTGVVGNIRPDIIGIDSTGSGLVTSDANGFRLLTSADTALGYFAPGASNYLATATPAFVTSTGGTVANAAATSNVFLSAGTSLYGSNTVNSLTLKSGGGLAANGGGLAGVLFSNFGTLDTLTVSSGAIVAQSGNLGVSGGAITAGSALLYLHAMGDLTLDAYVLGSGGVVKDGAGNLVLDRSSYNTAATFVNEGRLTLSAGNNTLLVAQTSTTPTVYDLVVNAGSVDLNGTSQVVKNVTHTTTTTFSGGAGAVVNTSTSASTLFTLMGSDINFAGTLGGTGGNNFGVDKSGNYNWTLFSPGTYAGATFVRGGTMTLRDDATIGGGGAVTVNYGTLAMNNTGLAHVVARTGTSAVSLNGGTLSYSARLEGETSATLGALTLASGTNTIAFAAQAGNGGSLNLTAASLARTAGSGAILNITATDGQLGRGYSASNGQAPQLTFTTAPTLTNNLIGGWAIYNGADFLTYLSTASTSGAIGVGILGDTGAGFAGSTTVRSSAGNISDSASNNYKSSGSFDTNVDGSASLNSLNMIVGANGNSLTFTGLGDTLTLTTGGFLRSGNFTGNLGQSVDWGRLTATTSELFLYNNQNTLTVNSRLTGTGKKVVFSGAGTFALTNGKSNLQLLASSTGTTTVTLASTVGLFPGQKVTGTFGGSAYTGTISTIVDATTVTLSAAPASATGFLSFGTAGSTALSGVVHTSGTNTFTVATPNTNLHVGQALFSSSIPAGTTITAISADGLTVTMSANSTAAFSAPTVGTPGNNYTGGTVVNNGTTVSLTPVRTGEVVIPAGGLTINGGVVNFGATIFGAIDPTNAVTINGGGTLTFPNYALLAPSTPIYNTLASLTFGNIGGVATPTLALGTPAAGQLSRIVLSGASAITSVNDNLAYTPTISGGTGASLEFSNASPGINVSGLSPMGLIISGQVTQNVGNTNAISKTGNGSLVLTSTTSNWRTGLTLNGGTLILGANSSSTAPTSTGGFSLSGGPLGLGGLTVADGTTLMSGASAATVLNAITFTGNATFGGNVAANNLTLGGVTVLGAATRTLTVSSPQVTATLAGPISGSASVGLTKNGNGILKLSSPGNAYTGATTVSAGLLQMGVANALPLAGAVSMGSSGVFDVAGFATTIGALTGSGLIANSGSAATLTINNSSAATFSGQFAQGTNALSVSKLGAGDLTLSGLNTATGALTIGQGNVALSGAAGSAAFATTINAGGTLTIDNTTYLTNRLQGKNLTIQGGTFVYGGNGASAASETIGTLTAQVGAGLITLNGGAGGATLLTASSLASANAGSSGLIRGASLGSAAGANVANLTVTTFNVLGSQGTGANGTTTMAIRSEILGDASATGAGTGFLVKDSTTGFLRPLATAELSSTLANGSTVNTGNFASVQNYSGALAVNSLSLVTTSGITVTGAGQAVNGGVVQRFAGGGSLATLTLTTGGIMATASATLNFGALTTTNGLYNIHAVGAGTTLDFNGYMTGAKSIMKAGAGQVNINYAAFNGATYVNAGKLKLNSGAANTLVLAVSNTASTAQALTIDGGTLDLNGFDQSFTAISSTNAVPGQAGTITSSTAANLISNASTSTTFAGSIGGALNLYKEGSGTLTLTGANAYTGTTNVFGGGLTLQDSATLASTTVNVGGATLSFVNNGLTNNNARFAAGSLVNLSSGTIALTGANQASTAVALGSTGAGVTLAQGSNVLALTAPAAASGNNVSLTVGNLTRSAGTTLSFAGTALGSSVTGASQISVTNINGSAAANTNGILGGWAVAGATAATADGWAALVPVQTSVAATTTAFSNAVTVASTAGLVVGQPVSGGNIPAGSFITAISSATAFTISTNATVSGAANSNFAAAGIAPLNAYAYTAINAAGTVGATTTATGNYSLQLATTGTVTLATGGNTVNSLQLAPTAAVATILDLNGSNLVVTSGGILRASTFSAANTIQATGGGTLTAGSGAAAAELFVVNNAAGAFTIGAVIADNTGTGPVSLVKSGTGPLTLTAANTYTGNTFVNAGTLTLAGATASSVVAPGNLTVNSGATVNTTLTANLGMAASASVTVNGAGTFTLAGLTTASTNYDLASLTFNNNGGSATPSIVLPGVATGVLRLSAANAITAASDNAGTVATISGTGLLSLTNVAPVISTTTNIVSKVTPDLAITGIISAAGGQIVKAGNGSLVLAAANTFTTGLMLQDGALILNNAAALGTTAGTFAIGDSVTANAVPLTILAGSASLTTNAIPVSVNRDFTFGGTASTNNLNLAGAINLGATTRTVTVSAPGVTGTLSGVLSSTATGTALIKEGPGILVVSAASGLAGAGVTVAGGVLKLGANDAIPNTSAIVVNAGAVLDLGGFNLNNPQLSGSGFFTNSSATSSTILVGGTSATDVTSTTNVSMGQTLADTAATKLGITKAGLGTLTFTNTNSTNYGDILVVAGKVVGSAANTFSPNATIVLGNASTATAATPTATLDVLGFDQTIGGIATGTHTAAGSAIIRIGAGRTLTTTGTNTLGSNISATDVSKVNFTDGGALVANGALFQVGGATGGTNASTLTVDMTALASFTVNSGASGIFRLGEQTTGTNGGAATLILSPANVITANLISLGDTSNGTAVQTLKLGSGTNVLNANTITIGAAPVSGNRGSGVIVFNGITGSVKVRSLNDTANGRANLNMAFLGGTTGSPITADFNVTGHSADLRFDVMQLAQRTGTAAGAATATFAFDTGTLDANDLLLGYKATTGNSSTATMTLSGTGASTFNSATNAMRIGVNAGTTSTATGTLNISGGTVTVTGNAGTAIKLGDASAAGGTAAGTINLTGGTLTVTGDIIRGATTGTSTAVLTLDGGTLDLSGNDLGGNGSATGNLTTTTFASGTLKNVGKISDTGGVSKTGANTLTIAGTAAYTGATTVSAGTLVLSSSSSSTSGITINGGTSTVLQVTNAAASGPGMLGVVTGATTPMIKFTIDGGGTIALPNSFGGNSGIVTTFYVDNNGTGTNGVIQLNGTTSSGLGNSTINVTGANGYSLYIASLTNTAGALGSMTFSPTTAALDLGNLTVGRTTGTGTFVLGGTNTGSKVSGIISDGSGTSLGGLSAITKNGTGTWTLTGANTYTGATLVSAGTLSAASGALAGTSGITVNGAILTAVNFKSGATLTLDATGKATISGAGQNVGAVTNANAIDANALNFTAPTGIITLASLSGAGKTTFGSDATVTGGISGGVVNVTGALNAASITGGTHSITGAATVTTVNGGTTSIGGVATITTLTSGTVNLTAATGTVTNVNGGTLTLAGTALTATNGTGSAALTLDAVSSASFSGAGETLGAITNANTADDSLLFSAATGTVTLTSLGGAGKTRFASNSSIGTLSGGTVTVDGSTATITTLNGGNISLGSTALTVSGGTHGGVISGANGSLTKSGPGTLILTGANTFGGGTTISAGTLQLGNGGTTGSVAAGDITNAGTFAISRSDDLTFASKITGAGAFTKLSANNLTLTGANDFTGATLVSAGTLTVSAGALAGTSGITVNGAIFAAANYNLGATLALDANATATISTADLTITGAIANAGTTADALNFSASTGKIILTSLAGAGKTRFGAAADITGGVSEGTVTVVGALGANITGGTVNAASLTGNVSAGTVTVTNLISGNVTGGTVTAGSLTGNVSGGAVTLTGALTGNVLAGAGTVSAGSMTGDAGSSVTVSGLLTGAITAGTNSLGSLSSASITGGTNTITGAATVTTVTGGTTTVGGVATVTTLTTGTLNLNGATSSIGTLTDGTINLGTTALTVNDGTFAGLLAGANGSLIKATAGTLTLSGANTFGGGTSVNLGTLIVGNVGSLGTGAVTVANGATLNLAGFGVTNAITVATGGTIEGGPTAASPAVVAALSGTNSITTVLTGTTGLAKDGSGELSLTTPHFFTGAVTANTAGAVIKAAFLSDTSSSLGASDLSVPSNLTLGSGAKLEFNGSTNTSTARSFTIGGSAGIAATGTGTLEFTSTSNFATTGDTPGLTLSASNTGTNRFAPTLASGNPLATLAIDGTGVWVIGTGANRFKGDIRIDAGAGSTIGLENNALPSGATLAVANNATIRWEAGNTTGVKLEIAAGTAAKLDLGSNNVVFSNAPVVASGSGTTATFEKQGNGTLTIAASVDASSFNFTLPANSGMLSVGAGGSIGNVSLATGSKLGGTGTVGNVTASSGSTVGPGNSPGTLGGTTIRLDGGSIFEWQVQDAKETTVNPGYDKLTLSGNLDLTHASAGNKITLKIVSLLGAGDGNTLGNPLNFDAPAGASSIRVFNFATVAGNVLTNSGEQISDVFSINVDQFKYSDGSASNAGLWSINWDAANHLITVTAVPEPSTYGFGLGALALAAAAIRRRRKNQPKA